MHSTEKTCRQDIFRNSKTNASECLENIEEMLPITVIGGITNAK